MDAMVCRLKAGLRTKTNYKRRRVAKFTRALRRNLSIVLFDQLGRAAEHQRAEFDELVLTFFGPADFDADEEFAVFAFVLIDGENHAVDGVTGIVGDLDEIVGVAGWDQALGKIRAHVGDDGAGDHRGFGFLDGAAVAARAGEDHAEDADEAGDENREGDEQFDQRHAARAAAEIFVWDSGHHFPLMMVLGLRFWAFLRWKYNSSGVVSSRQLGMKTTRWKTLPVRTTASDWCSRGRVPRTPRSSTWKVPSAFFEYLIHSSSMMM